MAVVDALAAHFYAQAVELCINPFDLLGCREKRDPATVDDTDFRHRIAEDCPSFGIILDVAKANKHAVLTRGEPQVKRSDQTVSKSSGFGLGPFGKGRYGGVDQVMVQFDGGEEIYLEHKILEAHAMLLTLVDLLGQQ